MPQTEQVALDGSGSTAAPPAASVSRVDTPPHEHVPVADSLEFLALRRVADGDSDAMEVIFARWKLPLLSFFYRATGSRADAEDLTLLTLDRVYRAAHRYRDEGHFAGWLFAIARRELGHEWRRLRRRPVVAVTAEELAIEQADGAEADRRRLAELEECLLVALRSCKPREREALLLAASGRLSQAEIATALGVSQNHLGVILHRGRESLKALLNKSFT